MSYVMMRKFVDDARGLDVEDKIQVIMILLDSMKPEPPEMDDDEAMRLFDHFTGRMAVGKGFDLQAEKNSCLDSLGSSVSL